MWDSRQWELWSESSSRRFPDCIVETQRRQLGGERTASPGRQAGSGVAEHWLMGWSW